MKKWMILLVGLLLITGCSGAGGEPEAEPEEVAPVEIQELSGKVVAEAAIEPYYYHAVDIDFSADLLSWFTPSLHHSIYGGHTMKV